MKLLDLFCGAGGAAEGYRRAGFDSITGIDVKPQPRYPFTFLQGDALAFVAQHGAEFDAIHASPPCQHFSTMTPKRSRGAHVDLVEPVRDALRAAARPFAIENVVGAPLRWPVLLCGTMFGLRVRRHRLFEMSPRPLIGAVCRHQAPYLEERSYAVAATARRQAGERSRFAHVYGSTREKSEAAAWREAMGIDWMTAAELCQAIPPAYTEWVGRHLLQAAARNPARDVGPGRARGGAVDS